MKDLLSELAIARANIDSATEMHKQLIAENIISALDYIAEKYENVIFSIFVVGYTPQFNDGESCYHIDDFGINLEDFDLHGLESEMDKHFNLENVSEDVLEKMRHNPRIKEINDFCHAALIPYNNNKHGTDYITVYKFENGGWEKHEDLFDCGY